MRRNCDSCGQPYEAKRKASRFCSDTCRKRNQRSPSPPVQANPVDITAGQLAEVTMRTLGDVDRLDTVLGQQAVALAVRIDNSAGETGSGVASLSKEFRAVMDVAMEGVGAKADPLDELRARRDAKRAAG